MELDAAADAASIVAVLIAKTLDASLILFESTFPSPIAHRSRLLLPTKLLKLPPSHTAPNTTRGLTLVFHGGGTLWGWFKRP